MFGFTPEKRDEINSTTSQAELERQQSLYYSDYLKKGPKPGAGRGAIDMKPLDNQLKSLSIKNMKKLHLVTAVLDRIAHFHGLGVNFSAHDVTSALRDSVAEGIMQIVDITDYDWYEGRYSPTISHEEVRSIVRELFEQNRVPDYTPKFTEETGLPFVLYTKDGNSIDSHTPSNNDNTLGGFFTGSQIAPLPVLTSPPVAGQTSVVGNVHSVNSHKATDEEMWQKAEQYLRNKIALQQDVTAKQIQSRLKGYAVTCAEIVDELTNRGYRFSVTENASTAKV